MEIFQNIIKNKESRVHYLAVIICTVCPLFSSKKKSAKREILHFELSEDMLRLINYMCNINFQMF